MRWRSSRSSTGSVESLGPDEGGPAAGRVAERAVGGPTGQGRLLGEISTTSDMKMIPS